VVKNTVLPGSSPWGAQKVKELETGWSEFEPGGYGVRGARKERKMKKMRRLMTAVLAMGLVLWAGPGTSFGQDSVVGVLKDYGQQPVSELAAGVVMWSWSEEVKKQAKTFSQVQVIEQEGARALSLTVTDKMPWGANESYRVMPVGPDLLSPLVDAVRIRCKVVEGEVSISVGGPTIYFGHSDVMTEPVKLSAKDGQGWRDVVVKLDDRLVRNFRRAGFAKDSPVIYYTRWVQEPMGLYVHKGSVGTVLIEKVEVLNQGRGRATATFAEKDVKVVSEIAGFGEAKDVERVFTATHESADFSGPAKLTRANWKPGVVGLKAEAGDGHAGVLTVEQQGAEEVVFTGMKVTGEKEANAIALDIKVSNPLAIQEVSVDWVLYAAPVGKGLDWEKLRAPMEWRGEKDKSFDFYMSEKGMRGESYALYHARRAMPNGKWVRVIVPLADFVCVYGAGEMKESMEKQTPVDGAQVVALGWLPSFRQNKRATTFEIDRVQWVKVPGEGAALRSFWQVDPAKVKLEPWGERGAKEMVGAP
jgi:hypothetical protein